MGESLNSPCSGARSSVPCLALIGTGQLPYLEEQLGTPAGSLEALDSELENGRCHLSFTGTLHVLSWGEFTPMGVFMRGVPPHGFSPFSSAGSLVGVFLCPL